MFQLLHDEFCFFLYQLFVDFPTRLSWAKLHLQFLLALFPAVTNCSLHLIQTVLLLSCRFFPEACAQHDIGLNVLEPFQN